MACFYRAALNAGRSVARKVSVCLSVCLSVKRVDCDETKKKYVHTKDHLAYSTFLRKKRLVASDPFYRKFWVILNALERNRRFSVDIRS